MLLQQESWSAPLTVVVLLGASARAECAHKALVPVGARLLRLMQRPLPAIPCPTARFAISSFPHWRIATRMPDGNIRARS